MLRRLMLSALALSAFLALQGCGGDRLVAPQVTVVDPAPPAQQPHPTPAPEPVGRPRTDGLDGRREDGGGDTGGFGGPVLDDGGAAADSLNWDDGQR